MERPDGYCFSDENRLLRHNARDRRRAIENAGRRCDVLP